MTMMRDAHSAMTAPIPCPYCHMPNNCASLDGSRPTRNSAGLCWHCGKVGMYDFDSLGRLIMRKPTEEEVAELAAHPDMPSLLAARAATRNPFEANRRRRRDRGSRERRS